MRMRYAMQSKRSDVGMPLHELRGGPHHKRSPTAENDIAPHIQTFDVVESHYQRKDCIYQFLPIRLNKTRIYRISLDWCKDNDKAHQK